MPGVPGQVTADPDPAWSPVHDTPADTPAPSLRLDHIPIIAHSSRANATNVTVISPPMILAIAVPSSRVCGQVARQ